MNLLNLFRPSVSPPSSSGSPRRATVALGGGGARGLAHLGVLQALGEAGVQTERIVGVSMGSLVGAMCAAYPDIHRAEAKAMELLYSPAFKQRQRELFGAAPSDAEESSSGIFPWYGRIRQYLSAHRKLNRAVTSASLISEQPLRDSIDFLLPDVDIEDLPLPLSIVAVDLLSGQRVVLESGPLREAVRASAAIPGIFPPVPWRNMLLSDIGVIESVPTFVAKAYATDLTVAVDVGQNLTRIDHCQTAMEIMMRVDDICERLVRGQMLDIADVVVRPDVGHVAWFDFNNPERLMERGRQAAHQALAATRAAEAA